MEQDNLGQNQQPDYSFLQDQSPQQSKVPGLGKLNTADKKTRILIVAAGAGILFAIMGIVAAILFGGGDDTNRNFVGLAQRQNEIIRVAEIGIDDARSQETLNFAITTRATLNSSRKRVVDNVTAKGVELDRQSLRVRENAQTTEDLSAAKQANRFDEVFLETIQKELEEYQSAIEITAIGLGEGTDLNLLRSLNEEVNILLGQLEDVD